MIRGEGRSCIVGNVIEEMRVGLGRRGGEDTGEVKELRLYDSVHTCFPRRPVWI